jgi:peptidoglycan/LPS O-acetylase OafA/YrhL
MLSARGEGRAPGLDGIRGAAVAAIVAYHLGLCDGGLLSVSVFFALSGYLITSILLSSWRKRGTLDLGTFWLRRARRLLPALFMLLPVVLFAASFARKSKLEAYGKQAIAALFYMANWATILRGDTYFNRFSGPGPFDHLWSLAIEEQFYAVWPLFLMAMLFVFARKSNDETARRRVPVMVMIITAVTAAASAVCMGLRYIPDAMNNTRAYEGTDCRAAPILIGALTAMLVPLSRIAKGGAARRVMLDVAGSIAAGAVVGVVLGVDEQSFLLYRGGESFVALATGVVILAAGHPETIVGKVFGFLPFRWLGERTYGIYLWHLPIIAFMPPTVLEAHPLARAGVQLGITLVLAALSWTLLEDPIRRNGLVATFLKGGVKSGGWPTARRWVGVTALIPLATAALGVWPLVSDTSASEIDFESLTNDLDVDTSAAPTTTEFAMETAPSASADSPTNPSAKLQSLQTSCSVLVHVGDSTSLGLISKKYIPDDGDRLDARYRDVGVRIFVPEISGGRAIVEKIKQTQKNAWEIVTAKASGGYKGCWVIALGIGDSATLRGNVDGLSQRIDSIMTAAKGAPVMWTTGKTLLDKGPYQNAYLDAWNAALTEACDRHPEMRVYDWASEAQDDWYLPDKIHPNEIGSKERAARIAKAVAVAFPKGAPAHEGCVVKSML